MLTTPRLLLRRWRREDREPFAALNADPEVMRHFHAPLDRAASDAFVDRIDASFDELGYGLWAVEVVADGRFIGFGEVRLGEIVSMTTRTNERSQAVMRRLGMTRDPADDFDHPRLPEDHPLRPHVLYRLTRGQWGAD